jgi:hypothetical protein
MVVERRIITGIEDIKAVIFECVKCKSRTSHSPDRAIDVPYACVCGHLWRKEDHSARMARMEQSSVQFVSAIAALRMVDRENPLGFKILLEFEEPKA